MGKATLKPVEKEYQSYRFQFELANDVRATLVYDNSAEAHTLNYDYTYQQKSDRKSLLTIIQRVHTNYSNGVINDQIDVTYEIVNHEKRGKKYLAGLDVSPNSKIFLEFKYERDDDKYVLTEIIKGMDLLYDKSDVKNNSLVMLRESPINITSELIIEFGRFNIPLCKTESGESKFILLSENYQQ